MSFAFFPTREGTKARRGYRRGCEWCQGNIQKGEAHASWSYAEDGTAHRLRVHTECFKPLQDSVEDQGFCIEGHKRGEECDGH